METQLQPSQLGKFVQTITEATQDEKLPSKKKHTVF